MKLISKKELNQFNDEEYIWYACYGSNINYKRFMYYINGDENGKLSTIAGCIDKTQPVEERKYIFNHPIYFAGKSKRWGGGGMAFLDCDNTGKGYGKIYKIKMSQFKGILEQEQHCRLYNAIFSLGYIDEIPVFTFTSKHKLKYRLNQPNEKYIKVIKEGLLDLYSELDESTINKYLMY